MGIFSSTAPCTVIKCSLKYFSFRIRTSSPRLQPFTHVPVGMVLPRQLGTGTFVHSTGHRGISRVSHTPRSSTSARERTADDFPPSNTDILLSERNSCSVLLHSNKSKVLPYTAGMLHIRGFPPRSLDCFPNRRRAFRKRHFCERKAELGYTLHTNTRSLMAHSHLRVTLHIQK